MKRYKKEEKEEVLKKIRDGQRVSEVAKVHGINEQSIRNWLVRDTDSGAAETLELSRLRRENESLLRIIGQLTYESEVQKKISVVNGTECSKTQAAKELGVSRSSLYYQHKLPAKDEALRREIEALMMENPGYGSPRVAIALKINEKRAARVMKKFGLKPARRAKIPHKPHDVGRKDRKRPNILSKFSPIAPNVVWVSDFTFIEYGGQFVYLCTVLDLFTGEVLGFNISRRHTAGFVKLAIERAMRKTGGALPEYFHSDQGSEYDSATIADWLESLGVTISMNPKGSPWCNGSQESFFGRFKVEFGEFDRFDSFADLLEALYSQLHYFSNVRIKTKLRMSPAQFREQWEQRHQQLLTAINSYSQVISLPPDPPRPYFEQTVTLRTEATIQATTTNYLYLKN